jgi:hypothetical protein
MVGFSGVPDLGNFASDDSSDLPNAQSSTESPRGRTHTRLLYVLAVRPDSKARITPPWNEVSSILSGRQVEKKGHDALTPYLESRTVGELTKYMIGKFHKCPRQLGSRENMILRADRSLKFMQKFIYKMPVHLHFRLKTIKMEEGAYFSWGYFCRIADKLDPDTIKNFSSVQLTCQSLLPAYRTVTNRVNPIITDLCGRIIYELHFKDIDFDKEIALKDLRTLISFFKNLKEVHFENCQSTHLVMLKPPMCE